MKRVPGYGKKFMNLKTKFANLRKFHKFREFFFGNLKISGPQSFRRGPWAPPGLGGEPTLRGVPLCLVVSVMNFAKWEISSHVNKQVQGFCISMEHNPIGEPKDSRAKAVNLGCVPQQMMCIVVANNNVKNVSDDAKTM